VLVRDGFKGPVWCSHAARDLTPSGAAARAEAPGTNAPVDPDMKNPAEAG
jgi:hypothetical protein